MNFAQNFDAVDYFEREINASGQNEWLAKFLILAWESILAET